MRHRRIWAPGQWARWDPFFRPTCWASPRANPRVDGNGTHTDFLRPAILIYEPQADGSLELVAVENLVFQRAWHAAGNAERPSFRVPRSHGRRRAGDRPICSSPIDRHVWVFRDNPNGVFAPFNPSVTCPSTMAMAGHAGH